MFKWFDENIFNHVGRRIQKYAIISFIVDIIACVISIFLITSDDPFVALIILLCGLGFAFIFAYPIYAFGQLVEDIHQTQKNTNLGATNIDELPEL